MKHKSINNPYINNPSESVLQHKLLFINGNIPLKARLYTTTTVYCMSVSFSRGSCHLKNIKSCSKQSWPKFGYSKHCVQSFLYGFLFLSLLCFLALLYFFKNVTTCKYCCHLYVVILCTILCHVKSDSRFVDFQ